MEAASGADPLLQAQLVDLQTWLVGDILTKVDRASMANSLEVRSPFLDYEMVAWGLALPRRLKLRGQEGKAVLKRALEPLLPREVLYGAKRGFTQRLGPQFRRGAGRIRARLLKGPMADSGMFRPEAVARIVDDHEAGRADNAVALWQLLVFEGFLAREAGVVPAQARGAGQRAHRGPARVLQRAPLVQVCVERHLGREVREEGEQVRGGFALRCARV